MKKSIYVLLIVCFAFSCSSDDDGSKRPFVGKTITSKILAPNGIDPISGATVLLSKNGVEISTTTTGVDGVFSIAGISDGEHNIKISKGLFSVERSFDGSTVAGAIGDFSFDDFPNIAVVTGLYDNIESILLDIGLANPETGEPLFDIIDGTAFRRANIENVNTHRHHKTTQRSNKSLDSNVEFSFEEFMNSPELMANYDAIFFNCGLSESYIDSSNNLTNYINNGGIFYATDWAFEYLADVTNNGEDFLQFLEPDRSGISLETTGTILSEELAEWLEVNYDISENGELYIDEFLPAWQVVEGYDDDVVMSWFNGEVSYNTDDGEVTEIKDLMFTFKYGLGTVIYSSFHTENTDEGFTNVDRIMEYQIFNLGN